MTAEDTTTRRGLIEEEIKSGATYESIGAKWGLTRQRVQQYAARIGHNRHLLTLPKVVKVSRGKAGRPSLAPIQVQCALCLGWFTLVGQRLSQYKYWKRRAKGVVRVWCPLCVKRVRG